MGVLHVRKSASMLRLPNWVVSAASGSLFLMLLVGVELGHRRLYPNYLVELDPVGSENVYSETYGWTLRPGFHGVRGPQETINADGYRGPRHSLEKPTGRQRVVTLGAS